MIKSSNNLVCILSFFIYDFNTKVLLKIEWIIHTPALQQMYHEEWIVNLIDIPINKHILMTVLGTSNLSDFIFDEMNEELVCVFVNYTFILKIYFFYVLVFILV